MRVFSEKEFERIIKAAVTETANGVLEWIEKETDLVDKNTKTVLPDAEIDLKPNPKGVLAHYVYPRLEKHGIIITETSDKP